MNIFQPIATKIDTQLNLTYKNSSAKFRVFKFIGCIENGERKRKFEKSRNFEFSEAHDFKTRRLIFLNFCIRNTRIWFFKTYMVKFYTKSRKVPKKNNFVFFGSKKIKNRRKINFRGRNRKNVKE